MVFVALVQGFYYLVTGVWPILHMDSFLKVTGPKTDLWLVKTVGVLIIVISSGLIYAGITNQFNTPMLMIAMASTVGFIVVELVYVFKHVISPVYAMDALAQFGLLVWWILVLVYR